MPYSPYLENELLAEEIGRGLSGKDPQSGPPLLGGQCEVFLGK